MRVELMITVFHLSPFISPAHAPIVLFMHPLPFRYITACKSSPSTQTMQYLLSPSPTHTIKLTSIFISHSLYFLMAIIHRFLVRHSFIWDVYDSVFYNTLGFVVHGVSGLLIFAFSFVRLPSITSPQTKLYTLTPHPLKASLLHLSACLSICPSMAVRGS